MTSEELGAWYKMRGRLAKRQEIIESDLASLRKFEATTESEYAHGVANGENRQLKYWQSSIVSMLKDIERIIKEEEDAREENNLPF